MLDTFSIILGLPHSACACHSYGASKAALAGYARCLAVELGGRGIRVNVVEPGYIETDMTAGVDASRRERIVARTPLQRLGSAQDVANMVAFLADPALAGFITGQTFRVDGGLSITSL